MRVQLWSAGNDGCRYYRMQLPGEQLSRLGHTVQLSQLRDRDFNPDVVVGQRVTNNAPSGWWRKPSSAFKIYELDDDLLNIPEGNQAKEFFGIFDNRVNIRSNLFHADRVVVSTEHLAEVVSKYTADAVCVPNTVPRWLTEWKRPKRKRLTIGWAGSPTHSIDWTCAQDSVRDFVDNRSDVQLHIMGGGYQVAKNMRETAWFEDVPSYLRAIDFDIGLAPLAPHPFNLSKSPIKVLELGALGVPVIASRYGPYAGFVVHGQTGYLADTPEDWTKYLRILTEDASLRRGMGLAARALASNYVVEGRAEEWEKAYDPSNGANSR